MSLYEKTVYTANISYLTNTFIYEYDISKCNINVLYIRGLINKNTYDYLNNAERMVREIYVGKLQRSNKDISNQLKIGIAEARRIFFESNKITDNDVLSIKNDAVFLINKRPQDTKFGLIEFKPKHEYTAFYKISNLECFYYYNSISQDEAITIKGISDNTLPLHEGYFLQLLKDVMYSIQVNGPEISMKMLKDFYIEYINLQLPVEYYRSFDVSSKYKFRYKTNLGTTFESDVATDQDKPDLDISYNIKLLMELQRILISLYFNIHK